MNVCRCTLHSDDYGNAQTLSMLMSDKCFVFRAFDTIFDENIPDGSWAMVFYEPVNQFYQKHHWKNNQQVFDWRLIRYNLQRFNAMLCPESLVKSEYKYLLGADFKNPDTQSAMWFFTHIHAYRNIVIWPFSVSHVDHWFWLNLVRVFHVALRVLYAVAFEKIYTYIQLRQCCSASGVNKVNDRKSVTDIEMRLA